MQSAPQSAPHASLQTASLYLRYISIQIRTQMQYRVAFLLNLAADFFATFLSFAALALILQRFENIGGWRLGEVAFLYGLVQLSFGAVEMAFAGFAPKAFSRRVRAGSFDQLLLRPVNMTLQILGSRFTLDSFGRGIQGVAIFGLALTILDVQWSVFKLAYLPVVILSMMAFFGGLFVINATITFWTIDARTAMNIFSYGSSEMIAYPMHIYPVWLRRIFTFFIPAIFLSYYPTLFFLDKPDPLNFPAFAPFLTPFVGGIVLFLAFRFWRFGLRHYQSTGS